MSIMKRLLTILLFLISTIALGQGVGINDDGSTPNTKAMLDVNSSTGLKGVLITRMTWANRPTGLSSTEDGLTIYVTDAGTDGSGYYYWDGTNSVWKKIVYNSPKTILPLVCDNQWPDNTTGYTGPCGWSSATESEVRTYMPKCVVTDFRLNVFTNEVTGNSCTFVLRKNGANQLTITIGAGGTGWYSTTGAISFAEGDYLTVSYSIGTRGGGTFYIYISGSCILYKPQN